MEKIRLFACLALNESNHVVLPDRRIRLHHRKFLAAAYCMHKAADKIGYARNTNFSTRVSWFTAAVSHLRAIPLLELGMVDGGRFGL